MKLLKKILGITSNVSADIVCLVDASSLIETYNKTGNGYSGPKEHFGSLRVLSQFAAREGFNFVIVFVGKQLREASNGSQYKGTAVYYVDNQTDLKSKAEELIRKYNASSKIMFITDNISLEKDVAKKVDYLMRLSTLKKGMEETGDFRQNMGRNYHQDNQRRYEGRNNPDGSRREPSNDEDDESTSKKNDIEGSTSPVEKRKTILNLIDPV